MQEYDIVYHDGSRVTNVDFCATDEQIDNVKDDLSALVIKHINFPIVTHYSLNVYAGKISIIAHFAPCCVA